MRSAVCHSAFGDAEYDLTGEVTGAINSTLFDLDRTTESFFANPYSLIPEPVGQSLIPRFSDETGIAVTNSSNRESSITYIARHFDGSLVAGDGIENPVTYRFAAGQQYAAFPCEIFRGQNEHDCGRILDVRLNGSAPSFGDRFTTGYVRLRSDSGRIAGDVSVSRQARGGSLSTSYPLTASLSDRFHFNQVAQGASSGIEHYTGIALANDSDKRVSVTVKVFRADAGLDRTASVSLRPYEQSSRLLSEILNDTAYRRLAGYIEVTASEPISALVLYGDVNQNFLAALPGLPR